MEGYGRLIDHQTAMGALLRERLLEAGWIVVNDAVLPVVNFTHPAIREGRTTTTAVRDALYASGRVWVSEVQLTGKERVMRACITSYETSPEDIEVLVDELERVVDR
jgi:glutamate/tyrosine decarboxylase-like PLP-dependent enzyme